MPCFHLSHVGEDVTVDEEGQELRGLEEAVTLAVTGARELIADLIVSGKAVDLRHVIRITDPQGRLLRDVPFADVLTFVR